MWKNSHGSRNRGIDPRGRNVEGELFGPKIVIDDHEGLGVDFEDLDRATADEAAEFLNGVAGSVEGTRRLREGVAALAMPASGGNPMKRSET
jgi:hypothetical protein